MKNLSYIVLLWALFSACDLSQVVQEEYENNHTETEDLTENNTDSETGNDPTEEVTEGESEEATTDRSLTPSFNVGEEKVIAFYNVENLFDAKDDPKTNDSQFLPGGDYGWNSSIYKQKLKNTAKVISELGGAAGPDVVGLCEIENKGVLKDLVKELNISGRDYKIVHEESKDHRGIDVALIYDANSFTYEGHQTHTPTLKWDRGYTTRDILEVKGSFANNEPIYLLVNHWPSRRGGQEKSESKRVEVAKAAKKAVDAIFAEDKDANILLMGDFNDDPFNKSIAQTLSAKENKNQVKDKGLFNVTGKLLDKNSTGTLTYQGKWNLFDQLIISEDMVAGQNPLRYVDNSTTIFNPEYVQVPYGRSKGHPRRGIFRGKYQKEGYSDHFAVFLKVSIH